MSQTTRKSRKTYQEILNEIRQLARQAVKSCTEIGAMISTAESCTGGMVSGAVTAIEGSSRVIELGVCSYSNRIKTQMLLVNERTLRHYSEYSTRCASEMALGVMRLAGADYAVATTGVAGPTGGSVEHPVGEVCIAVCSNNAMHSKRYIFTGDLDGAPSARDSIRALAARKALMLLNIMISAGNTENNP